jgi:hypothetical protein
MKFGVGVQYKNLSSYRVTRENRRSDSDTGFLPVISTFF